jgi:hypothetical protein
MGKTPAKRAPSAGQAQTPERKPSKSSNKKAGKEVSFKKSWLIYNDFSEKEEEEGQGYQAKGQQARSIDASHHASGAANTGYAKA